MTPFYSLNLASGILFVQPDVKRNIIDQRLISEGILLHKNEVRGHLFG